MMDPTSSARAQMDVLGENEALQQFFDGQDVSGVLESASVDTSMLEQYLSNDTDPSTFMLPESPPDSGSEPCSPPQVPDVHYSSCWPSGQVEHEVLPTLMPLSGSSCRFRDHTCEPQPTPPQFSSPRNIYLTANGPPTPCLAHSSPPCPQYQSPALSYTQVNAAPPLPNNLSAQSPQCTGPSPLRGCAALPCLTGCPSPDPVPHLYLPPTSRQQTGPALPDAKKRRLSESFEGSNPSEWGGRDWMGTLENPECTGGEAPSCESEMQGGGHGAYHLLTWDKYLSGQWCQVYGSSFENLPVPGYHVETDKGFNYSPADEAFVCQKKNHFQVTVHIGMAGSPRYVKTPSGSKPIESFHLKVFGVKLDTPSHLVTIEQSQSDRSKKPFLPVRVNLPEDKITKVTLGRLHFSETTSNNMRKKGKPNPDQRYFLLAVGLYASVEKEDHLLVAHMSERIIVRASNPGQFESDSEVLWQRGTAPDALVCHGRVGINTDSPDEALVVCGNVKVMGTVMHPSDKRAKQNIQEVDPTEQLKRIAQMRIVEYDYKPEFATTMGIGQLHETGIIAQEVRELLPSAVREAGNIICSDGEKIHNFLMVDKEQIFMENVGAVKQLCKLTDNLETRIQELEVWNKQLAQLKNTTSLPSTRASSMHRKISKSIHMPPPQIPSPKKPTSLQCTKDYVSQKFKHCLHHKAFQATIITLLAVMALCVMSITGLYMFNLRMDSSDTGISHEDSSNTPFPMMTTPSDVDFCNLLYCDEVHCCPAEPYNQSGPYDVPSTTPLSVSRSPLEDKKKQLLYKGLRGAKDWTNTTVKSIFIKENQLIIDQKYCVEGNCGHGNYSYTIPISKFVPVNMRITLQMNTTELLVVHLCHNEDTNTCSAMKDYSDAENDVESNTQGYIHEWPLPVARLSRSSYHFRTTVAGQADCSTHSTFVEMLFTDYHFHFYRRCD